jgi:hypothetical protein
MGREGMVDEVIRGAIVGVGRTGDQDYGQILSVCSADSVHGGKPTDAERHNRGSGSAHAGIALRGITAIQFIAAIDLLQVLVLQQLIKQHQIKLTRNCEVMFQTYL